MIELEVDCIISLHGILVHTRRLYNTLKPFASLLRSGMTFAVDWAFKKQSSIRLSGSLSFGNGIRLCPVVSVVRWDKG